MLWGSKKDTEETAEERLKRERQEMFDKLLDRLDVLRTKGFECNVCGEKHNFSVSGMKLIFCHGCGLVYHLEVLEEIFDE